MTTPVFAVLLNFNGWADTIECLESLLRSDDPAMRIIVVDNNSSDGSLRHLVGWAQGTIVAPQPKSEALRHLAWPPVPKPVEHIVVQPPEGPLERFPRVTFVAAEKNFGFAGGNNVGFRLILQTETSAHVCLVNNDMVVDSAAVRKMSEAMAKDSRLGAVGGLILDYRQPDLVQSIGGGSMSRLTGMSDLPGAGLRRDQASEPGSLGFVSGGWLMTSLAIVREVGLMDEAYFLYAEDADWGERMRANGYRLGCALDAFVWHKGSQATGARSPFQDYYLVRSSLMFVRKHARSFAWFAVVHSVFRMLAPKLIRGEWARARSVLRAYRSYARGT